MMSVVTRSGHDVIAGRYMAFFEPERVYKFPYPKKPIAHELATYVRQKIYNIYVAGEQIDEAEEAERLLFEHCPYPDEPCPYRKLGIDCTHECNLCIDFHRCLGCLQQMRPNVFIPHPSDRNFCPWLLPEAVGASQKNLNTGHGQLSLWRAFPGIVHPLCLHEIQPYDGELAYAGLPDVAPLEYLNWIKTLYRDSVREARVIARVYSLAGFMRIDHGLDSEPESSTEAATRRANAARIQNTPNVLGSVNNSSNVNASNQALVFGTAPVQDDEESDTSVDESSTDNEVEVEAEEKNESDPTVRLETEQSEGQEVVTIDDLVEVQEEDDDKENDDAIGIDRDEGLRRFREMAYNEDQDGEDDTGRQNPHGDEGFEWLEPPNEWQDKGDDDADDEDDDDFYGGDYGRDEIQFNEETGGGKIDQPGGADESQTAQESDESSSSSDDEADQGQAQQPGKSCAWCNEDDTPEMIMCNKLHVDPQTGQPMEVWCHFVCAGLEDDEVEEIEDFYCPDCVIFERKKITRRKSRPGANKSTPSEETSDEDEDNYKGGSDGDDDDDDDVDDGDDGGHAKETPKQVNQTKKPVPRQPKKPSTGETNKRQIKTWNDHEKQCVNQLMAVLVAEDSPESKTEQRWQVISTRMLAQYGVERSAGSIKNYWNRTGRQATGLDERGTKAPDRMVTGKQDAAKRKKARQNKKTKTPAGKSGSDEDKGEPNEKEMAEPDELEQSDDKVPGNEGSGVQYDNDDDDEDDEEDIPLAKRRRRV